MAKQITALVQDNLATLFAVSVFGLVAWKGVQELRMDRMEISFDLHIAQPGHYDAHATQQVLKRDIEYIRESLSRLEGKMDDIMPGNDNGG